jgi:hypothetical protein
MRSTRVPVHKLLLASVFLVVGCTEEPTAPRPPVAQPQAASALAARQRSQVAPVDDELLQVAASVPGFGGVYFDRTGRLTVFLTDTTQRAAVRAALMPLLGPTRSAALSSFRILPGRYGFGQLKQWSTSVNPTALSTPGVVFTDIDEGRNRLLIAVENAQARTRVASAISGLGVPRDAVLIEEHAPIVRLETLQDRQGGGMGGLQIEFDVFICTLGLNAQTYIPGQPGDGIQYFVTNSHCTNVQGGVENTRYYQPDIQAGNEIGVEVRDPDYISGGNCPPGRRCRHSDAALVRYDDPTNQWVRYIARTQFFDRVAGSITLADGMSDYFDMADFWGNPNRPPGYLAPVLGQTLYKVGRTTGWTDGPVANTCATVNVGGTDITLFCQLLVDGGADEGDSGAPVFSTPDDPYAPMGAAIAYGVLWGGTPDRRSFIFSGIPSINAELGTLYYCNC